VSLFDDRVEALASRAPGTIGMLAWIDPTGQRWIAPLGSPAPDPDRLVPPAWTPIKHLDRSELEPQ